jgi:choline dehydrogenase-like flavoprotein
MSFLDAARDHLVEEADFVVVGSGAGGGAATRALAAAGRSVVVLEEGPMPVTAELGVVASRSMAKLFRHQGKMAAFGKSTVPMLQGRCVGGTTFVNSAIIWRIPDKVVADWRTRGLSPLVDGGQLEAAYARIESEMSVRPVDPAVNANRQDLLMRDGAASRNMTARFVQRGDRDCHGSGRCLHGCPYEAKQSTTVNYLRRAVTDGAAVYANAEVRRVVVEAGRATGVLVRLPDGEQAFVRARRAVVVCASAIQSPNLLRRSGIRHRDLGRHFMAHPGTTVMALYPDRVDMWSGASQGFEVLALRDTVGVKLESINVPPEVVAARLPGAGTRLAGYIEKLDHIASWAVAVRADAVGHIAPSYIFKDRVHYSLLASDVARIRTGMKTLAEIHFAAGAREIITGVHGMPEILTSPDQLSAFDSAPVDPRAYSMVATHLFGGCRAGSDPETSVVSPELAVHGIGGLYVMDASVFPTNTGVNPQHSIMALATVASERLAASHL